MCFGSFEILMVNSMYVQFLTNLIQTMIMYFILTVFQVVFHILYIDTTKIRITDSFQLLEHWTQLCHTAT